MDGQPHDAMDRCNMLWLGPALGPVERACIRSVLTQGHPLSLYCYDEPRNVPAGVELRDAAAVLPRSAILRHVSGSVALFADRFRYTLMQHEVGLWLDCDMYVVAPIRRAGDYVLGLEEPGVIGTGILRIPADSLLLPPLLALFEENSVPSWLAMRARIAARLRLSFTGRSGIAKMPWGSIGPHALSSLAKAHNLHQLAAPPHLFFPVHWRDARWILEPGMTVEDKISPCTVSVHLWNQLIRPFKESRAPRGSFLARLQEEGS